MGTRRERAWEIHKGKIGIWKGVIGKWKGIIGKQMERKHRELDAKLMTHALSATISLNCCRALVPRRVCRSATCAQGGGGGGRWAQGGRAPVRGSS